MNLSTNYFIYSFEINTTGDSLIILLLREAEAYAKLLKLFLDFLDLKVTQIGLDLVEFEG